MLESGALGSIRTRFVRDRLAETIFARRESIQDLIHWETVAASGGPTGWAGHVFYGQFKHSHPVECQCILEELQDGTYTDPVAYRARLAGHAEEVRLAHEAELRARREKAWELRQAWVRAGGKP